MRHVVSISLGTSKRNKRQEVEVLGQPFLIERIGTDGDTKAFAKMFSDLDGKVDAIGVGGADLYLIAGNRKYAFRQISKLVAGAKMTPVVDGSGLKHTLERETVFNLQASGVVDFRQSNVLMVAAVDRFGMAQAFDELGAKVLYGDLMFGLGLPIPIRSYRTVQQLARLILPLMTKLPFQWFYPTGEKQESRTPKFGWAFTESDVIAGDWHFIRRYAPNDLSGKTILTQTLRKADLEWLSTSGATRAITTTPAMDGETFATNVMEGVLVALLQKPLGEIRTSDYLDLLKELDWKPNVFDFQATPESSIA